MINRKEEIKKKGFSMRTADTIVEDAFSEPHNVVDFSKIKVGLKTLDDAIVDLSNYKKLNPRLGDKAEVLRAINNCDYEAMRDISNFFYKTSGIYSRLCRYMAYLYRYDWLLTPYVVSDTVKPDKILEGFNKALVYLDNFEVKKYFGEVALKVIRNGCYYGYLVPQSDRMVIQELPPKYCRSRFFVGNRPAVEFNMKFFDDEYRDTTQRMKILNLFPPEFKKGYIKYKEGKLPADFIGDTAGWYLLEPNNVVKFNMNGEDFPAFISVIPAIIDLDEAQALDRKKMQQQLLKIIIQKMPMDKNGDLIFDVDEAQELHNNAVRMLGKAIGIDVLTTFAEVDVADMADNKTTTTTDELAKVERGVYNEAGVSQMQFNTDGNIALEKSILNDEAAMYNLLAQFEGFLNDMLRPYNKNPKKLYYKVQILTTTIYNYKEMAKLYKEQTQLGYSKMLPQIALGQSQSSILANAYFENDVLDLVNVFIPPLMSSTMNAEAIAKTDKNGSSSGDKDGKAGRNEKPDDQKSEKTIKNREAMNQEVNEMPRMSVATIKNPEFINLKPLEINPLMSACEIKVMYVGQNRNHSFITKEVATEMSKTLRGAPIVGWYREDKGDFADHGDRITIDNDGIKFESMTRPYGFVAPDAKVWFQEFEDTDDFGNKITREYLMTTGYIWDGQYKEAKCVTEHGKPHSMELDDETLDGKWSTDVKSGMEFFIVNDAIFSKLCILGDDVEPCFEGSSVTAPEVSKSFTMVDDDFKQSLYTMMQQLKFALEGGQSMAVQKIDGVNTEFSATQDNAEQTTVVENQNFTKDSSEDKKDEKDKKEEDYACAGGDEDKKKKDFAKEDEKDKKDDKEDKSADKEDDKEDNKKKDDKYTLLEEKFALLEQKYTALETEYQNLVSFKNNAENEKKDELIKSFYMLSDEDKKDVIENKSKYSLDEIESKLSVICVRKKVNFDLEDNSKSDNTVEDKPVTTFNLNGAGESVPAWITALRNTQNSRNI